MIDIFGFSMVLNNFTCLIMTKNYMTIDNQDYGECIFRDQISLFSMTLDMIDILCLVLENKTKTITEM